MTLIRKYCCKHWKVTQTQLNQSLGEANTWNNENEESKDNATTWNIFDKKPVKEMTEYEIVERMMWEN